MKKYYVQYKKRGEIIKTPKTTKQNAISKYLTMLIISDGLISELSILKQFNNGKIIDLTRTVNKFLKG